MRKILKRGLLFLLILILLLAGCSAWAKKAVVSKRGSIKGRSRVFADIAAEKENTLDVLVMGDSESFTSISPMQLWRQHGIAAYDCGQSGQKIQETYYMLKTALKTQEPRLVLLEANLMFRNPGRLENLQSAISEAMLYHFPIFRYHNIWKTMFDSSATLPDEYKGFTIRNSVKSYDGDENYMKETSELKKIPEFVDIYLKKIIEICRGKDIPLMLYSAPSPVNYNTAKHNAIQDYADKHNLPYLDLNYKTKELKINWKEDSYDKGDHLNVFGAEKVTAYMGEYLAEKYDLPDHRGEAEYEEWDRLAEMYRQEFLAVKGK